MRMVNLVESLNVRQVPLAGEDYIRIHRADELRPLGDGRFLCGVRIREEIVPVHELWRGHVGSYGMPDHISTYVAVTAEVQEFLRLPLDALAQRNKELTASLSDLKSEMIGFRARDNWLRKAPWKARLLFLLTGNVKCVTEPSGKWGLL